LSRHCTIRNDPSQTSARGEDLRGRQGDISAREEKGHALFSLRNHRRVGEGKKGAAVCSAHFNRKEKKKEGNRHTWRQVGGVRKGIPTMKKASHATFFEEKKNAGNNEGGRRKKWGHLPGNREVHQSRSCLYGEKKLQGGSRLSSVEKTECGDPVQPLRGGGKCSFSEMERKLYGWEEEERKKLEWKGPPYGGEEFAIKEGNAHQPTWEGIPGGHLRLPKWGGRPKNTRPS